MQTSELYTQMVQREKRLWITLAIMGIIWILTVGLFVALYISAISEQTKVIAYTPTGIPRYAELQDPSKREIIEVQTCAKEVLTQTFTLKYSEFLNREPQQAMMKVKPFFHEAYYSEFVSGLVTSRYIERLLELRAVTIVTVQDPVEVQVTQDAKYWVKATITRQDMTAKGERTHSLTYAILFKPGDRTTTNPWGLYVEKLYLMEG